MRKLLSGEHLGRSLLMGTVITAACVPHILLKNLPGVVLQALCLWPLSVAAWQCYEAWIPDTIKELSLSHQIPRRRLLWLMSFYAPVVLFQLAFLDDYSSTYVPDFRPASIGEFATGILWSSVFQPLFLIVLSYTFAYRLTKHRTASLIVVVLFGQLIAVLQELPLPLVLFAGVHALVRGVLFVRTGVQGLALFSAFVYGRLLLALL